MSACQVLAVWCDLGGGAHVSGCGTRGGTGGGGQDP